MKTNHLRNMSMQELMSKSRDLAQELFNLKFQLHTGRLENTSKISNLKKEIARVKTIIVEMKG
jgi:large subunit ribosomal protein L29